MTLTVRQDSEERRKNVSNVKEFLNSAPITKKVRLPSLIVLQRMGLSPREILSIGDAGSYTAAIVNDGNVELQIGESVVATGNIVEDSGEYYFEVTEVFHSSDEKKEENA